MRYPFWRIGRLHCCRGMAAAVGCIRPGRIVLGPDPGKVLVDRSGLGTLVLLLITLSMTPLQKLTGWAGWIAVRRQLGLVVFCLCGAASVSAIWRSFSGFDWSQLGVELRKRPYIIVGALGLSRFAGIGGDLQSL